MIISLYSLIEALENVAWKLTNTHIPIYVNGTMKIKSVELSQTNDGKIFVNICLEDTNTKPHPSVPTRGPQSVQMPSTVRTDTDCGPLTILKPNNNDYELN